MKTNHTAFQSAIFNFKVSYLIVKRTAKNIFSAKQIGGKKADGHNGYSTVYSSKSQLWNPFDGEKTLMLTAGKIQNLRVACAKINGIEVPANTVFSFWNLVGKPSSANGFVMGREVREGCIVPAIGGGLCQLSNALYDAALKAGFEIIERHKHSKVVKGSLAEINRDATIKWNYIDLQFKSPGSFYIEALMGAEELEIRIHTSASQTANSTLLQKNTHDDINNCNTCGQDDCNRHALVTAQALKTAVLLDEHWPEFNQYINTTHTDNTVYYVPYPLTGKLRRPKYAWNMPKNACIKPATITALLRSYKLRKLAIKGAAIQKEILKTDYKLAARYAELLTYDCTHLVITQSLLPHLWQMGALMGRSYDVLMTKLPINSIHSILNTAKKNHPESPTLGDFRADKQLQLAEQKALAGARKIITPHTYIAKLLGDKCTVIDWQLPSAKNNNIKGNKIVFPASALGRKGSYQIKQLAEELNLALAIGGNAMEFDGFWGNIKTEKWNRSFEGVAAIVLPAYIENNPRTLLAAIANNIPVICTENCGVEGLPGVITVAAGDYEALKNACKEHLLVPEQVV